MRVHVRHCRVCKKFTIKQNEQKWSEMFESTLEAISKGNPVAVEEFTCNQCHSDAEKLRIAKLCGSVC